MSIALRSIGAPLDRIDGPLKVTGAAKFAYEHDVEHVAYAFPVQSTIAKSRIAGIRATAALELPGVLAVLSHLNAVSLASTEELELAVFQTDRVGYQGQLVAAVVAESYEVARHAAALIEVTYDVEAHDVDLRADRSDLYKPDKVNANFPTDTKSGDPETALATAAFTIDRTYTTPYVHNQPLEPHATLATWTRDGSLLLYDANQGAHGIRDDVAKTFGLAPESVRVISPHVGGGFGSKAFTHPHVIMTVMAAKVAKRPVKVALTRQQMFSLVGYRTPTIQRVRLGADVEGRLVATAHEVIEVTSKMEEFAEQTAVATRTMYASPSRLTTHRLVALDVPTPSIMRAPGECPGMFALESAMDEMALACGLDPVAFRIRNEPETDPNSGRPFSSRSLVECLREGSRRFGWAGRDARPRMRHEGEWLVGSGVASSTYPTRRRPSSAKIRLEPSGRYSVLIDASDIGTGTWTALRQIAADALDVAFEQVDLEIGDSALPKAPGAGGSMGLSSWGSAVYDAAQNLRAKLERGHGGTAPAHGLEADGNFEKSAAPGRYSMHAFGAQFAEVRVNAYTGELRVPRLVGVFGVGQVVNAKTGRSQLLGGMTMGLSMALHEESTLDERFGHFANHDFAEYHIAVNADVGSIDVSWVDEEDTRVNPFGAKGIGEIGIVGTAAAIANAAYHATGIRVRDLPLRSEDFIT